MSKIDRIGTLSISGAAQDAIVIMQATAEIIAGASSGSAPVAEDKRLFLKTGSSIRLKDGTQTTIEWLGVSDSGTPGLFAKSDQKIYALSDVEAI